MMNTKQARTNIGNPPANWNAKVSRHQREPQASPVMFAPIRHTLFISGAYPVGVPWGNPELMTMTRMIRSTLCIAALLFAVPCHAADEARDAHHVAREIKIGGE